jgi:hypothetical protein
MGFVYALITLCTLVIGDLLFLRLDTLLLPQSKIGRFGSGANRDGRHIDRQL